MTTAGLTTKATQAESIWNMHQAWYASTHSKQSGETTKDYHACQMQHYEGHKDEPNYPQLWVDICKFWKESVTGAKDMSSKAMEEQVIHAGMPLGKLYKALNSVNQPEQLEVFRDADLKMFDIPLVINIFHQPLHLLSDSQAFLKGLPEDMDSPPADDASPSPLSPLPPSSPPTRPLLSHTRSDAHSHGGSHLHQNMHPQSC
ncbi:hypothetical protein EDC04DRAFT_2912197 [Pisolithus marmoratus]|nr:hypothetical protein EDC04DRAFT_2912197 [Pisolithus marmoratus]